MNVAIGCLFRASIPPCQYLLLFLVFIRHQRRLHYLSVIRDDIDGVPPYNRYPRYKPLHADIVPGRHKH